MREHFLCNVFQHLPQELIVRVLKSVDRTTLIFLCQEESLISRIARQVTPIKLKVCESQNHPRRNLPLDKWTNPSGTFLSTSGFEKNNLPKYSLFELHIYDMDIIVFHSKIPEFVSTLKIVLYISDYISAIPSADYKIADVIYTTK
ncbi:uncharacterized protein RJT20DRAFT_5955 [Scheffersomyces xylosifermentans]|uniref:uncharacterized protein n=1 Tax=Scheffersomyces xylosifermentans TaxID=1304137 RepID=UPI00315C73BE